VVEDLIHLRIEPGEFGGVDGIAHVDTLSKNNGSSELNGSIHSIPPIRCPFGGRAEQLLLVEEM
jgi:hypothetical protein